MKGTLSKVLIVIGVILIVAAILWWAIAVNLLVKFPSDVNVTPIYEGDVDVYQDLLTGQLVKQPTNFPLSIERHYESVSDEYDSSKAVVIESITQTVEVPLAPRRSWTPASTSSTARPSRTSTTPAAGPSSPGSR